MLNQGSGTGRHLCGSARKHWRHLFSAWREIPLEIKLIQFSSHTSLSLTQASWSLYLYKLLRLSSVKAQLSHTHC